MGEYRSRARLSREEKTGGQVSLGNMKGGCEAIIAKLGGKKAGQEGRPRRHPISLKPKAYLW
jgi:hypothetical protein